MIPFAMLASYPAPYRDQAWLPVAGGFSGARVFTSPTHVLKAWPIGTQADRVRDLHRDRSRIASLPFVPQLMPTKEERSFAEAEGVVWELNSRCPGASAVDLTDAQIKSAGNAIAEMHKLWSRAGTEARPITNRCNYVNHGLELLRHTRFSTADLELQILHREVLERFGPIRLDPYTPVTQLIHGDLHREHVLFTGGDVSGVIDFASIKRDHPAFDIARYFGELGCVSAGVEHYLAAGGSEAVTTGLVCDLVTVIAAGTVTHWLPKLAAGDYLPDQRSAIVGRIRGAIGRLT